MEYNDTESKCNNTKDRLRNIFKSMLIIKHIDWDRSYKITNKDFVDYATENLENNDFQWKKRTPLKAKVMILAHLMCYECLFTITRG